MPTQRVFYWHALDMPNTDLVHFSSITPAYNYQDFAEMQASQPFPQFQGATQATPGIQFSSRQIADILNTCTTFDLCAGFPSNTLKLYQRSGQPLGVREADSSVEHRVIDMENSGFLTWESINASQGQPAEINARLDPAYDGVNDPFVWTGSYTPPLPTLPGSVNIHTLGKVVLDGTSLTGVSTVRWNNNITREEQYSDGDPFPTLQGIRQYAPEIMITTTDQRLLNSFTGNTSRGYALTSLAVYLRRMDEAQIHVPDATAQHIGLTASNGLVVARSSTGSPNAVDLSIRLTGFGSSALFATDTAVAIP